MGLSGRKTKQRIGTDPRNLTWSDDSSKFGAKYLQSLGWTSGTGLGASGEGRVSNLKIHQKLDLLGIGGNRRAPGGDEAGWKGGREFEGLLARLNQTQNENDDEIAVDDSLSISIDNTQIVTVVGQQAAEQPKLESKDSEDSKRKRKRSAVDDDEEIDLKEAKRKRKEEKRLKKEKKKADKAIKNLKAVKPNSSESPKLKQAYLDTSKIDSIATATNTKPMPLFRAHRARHLASKRMAAASTTGMNEILGISPSVTPSSASPTPFPQRNSFSITPNEVRSPRESDTFYEKPVGLGFRGTKDETESRVQDSTDLLRKSEKSMADYFSEKMLLKKEHRGCPTSYS